MKKKNIKIILIVLIILILIFLSIRIYLCNYAFKLEDATSEALGNNYYIKVIEKDNANSKQNFQEIWYTEKKQTIKFGNIDTPETFSKIYHDSEKRISTLLPANSNMANVVVDKSANWFSLYSNNINFDSYLTNYEEDYMKSEISLGTKIKYLVKTFMEVKSIKEAQIDNKECYVVKNQNKTLYIEKESNLPIKIEEKEKTYTFEFSIGTVKEENVNIDNLSEFYVTLNAIIQ